MLQIFVPKFKVESEMNGKNVLEKMGVSKIFENTAKLDRVIHCFQ